MPSREGKKEQITRERQAQIMEAALEVFSRRGYGGATMPEIAREAGVAVGTIYNYYENKRDLLVAITNKYVIQTFTDIIKNPPAGGDFAFITSLIEDRLSLGPQGVARFLPLLMEVQRDEELRSRYLEHVVHPVMGMMEQFMAGKIHEGIFRDINPALIPRMVGGMVIGFLLFTTIEGESSPTLGMDRKQLVGELATFIINGLKREPGAPEKEC